MYLGLDFGTSSVKIVLVDAEQRVVASSSAPLTVSSPGPDHREQDPEHWWQALLALIDTLAQSHPREVASVVGIGLCGQMHGAILLDTAGKVLRPCILWNDGRAVAECADLHASLPDLAAITGNIAMPGFTAPKLLWVRRHEPDIFARTAKVLLPKAWIRFRMTGEMIEDMSDASGTLWLDVSRRDWSDASLAATGLNRTHMPRLVEGTEPAGRLLASLATRWRMGTRPLLAGGAGDNASGAVGLSAVNPGDAFISLGTSGVVWATTARFTPYPEATVHAFCHAVPNRWHQMGVTLSAAASLSWWAGVTGCAENSLLGELDAISAPAKVIFLPYLAGERTPYNDPSLRGVFAGLSAATGRAEMTRAVIEGVAFSLRQCLDVLRKSGTQIDQATVIGGGSRSAVWVRTLASVLGIVLHQIDEGETIGAFGAARLARIAFTGESVDRVCIPRSRVATILPVVTDADAYSAMYEKYQQLALVPQGARVGADHRPRTKR